MADKMTAFDCTLTNPNASDASVQLYLNGHFADIKLFYLNGLFDTDDGVQNVPARKLILANLSSKFHDMFFDTAKEVKIDDVAIDTFKKFLEFFYLLTVKLPMEQMKDVVLAKKHEMGNAKEM